MTSRDGGGDDFETTPFDLQVPDNFPLVSIPEDNPLTVEGVTLGRMLFYLAVALALLPVMKGSPPKEPQPPVEQRLADEFPGAGEVGEGTKPNFQGACKPIGKAVDQGIGLVGHTDNGNRFSSGVFLRFQFGMGFLWDTRSGKLIREYHWNSEFPFDRPKNDVELTRRCDVFENFQFTQSH